MEIKFIKKAIKDERVPSAEVLATFVESLNLFLNDNPNMDENLSNLIKHLPSPKRVKKVLSLEECRVLYETIEYLWNSITGQKIVTDEDLIEKPDKLFGTYWLIDNGILLHGTNHFTIIKQNSNILCSLLNIGGMTLQRYLNSPPNDLIKFIIKNGGVRIFVDKKGDGTFQMSQETYAKWGRNKVKKLDMKEKIVKVIDLKAPYNGWNSGIVIKL